MAEPDLPRISKVDENAEKTQKKFFWLSFDFGLKGDYKSLYEWLDKYNAKECGNNLAYVEFVTEHQVNNFDEFKKLIQEELEAAIDFTPNDRIYVLYGWEKGTNGAFIVGKRKRSIWEGYSSDSTSDIDSDKG